MKKLSDKKRRRILEQLEENPDLLQAVAVKFFLDNMKWEFETKITLIAKLVYRKLDFQEFEYEPKNSVIVGYDYFDCNGKQIPGHAHVIFPFAFHK